MLVDPRVPCCLLLAREVVRGLAAIVREMPTVVGSAAMAGRLPIGPTVSNEKLVSVTARALLREARADVGPALGVGSRICVE